MAADVAADVAADATDDVAADVAADVGDDVMMTSSLTRLRPDPTDPDIDPVRPDQRPDPVSDPTRTDPVNGQPISYCHALPHAPNLLVAREGACDGISGQT